MYRKAFIILPLLWLSILIKAQLCTTPGQTPVSAVLVCGVESFRANTPIYCGNTDVPVPCPATFPYKNKNPNFFRMACSRSGTLSFTIVPDEPAADYNWQLFDITSTNPNDIFTNPALFIACNWSSEPGETGASADGTTLQVCAGGGEPLFCNMPYIIDGHTYMLMVCNQSNSFFGYQLSFTGGTASITDNVEPHLLTARASCDWNRIIVKTNKKVVCSSLSGNGSDFSLSNGATIIGAIPGDCTSIFGTDSIVLNLNQPLTLGTYTLTLDNGNDGNTLMDICNRTIPTGEIITFTVTSSQPTLMDSIAPVTGCSPGFIELVFQKPIRCSSIAANGSDFIITGPQTVTTTFDPVGCNANATTSRVRLKFTTPIISGGTYQVSLTTGNDGNSIIDECGLATLIGATLSFSVNNALSAAFTIRNTASCKKDSIYFLHNGNNNTNNWNWDFGNGNTSTLQNPAFLFATPGSKKIKLTVSNSNCTDTSSQTITAGADLSASFDIPDFVCPGDTVHIVNKSTGTIDQWQWNFGDGNTYTGQTPVAYRYTATGREMVYTVSLIASNSLLNCSDVAKKTIRLLANCFIAVPSAFTPNNDGRNDYLFPMNAIKADNLQFSVFNRYGQLVFETKDWTKKWDGRINGQLQDTGVYAWILSYTHHDTGEKVFKRGTTLLLR